MLRRGATGDEWQPLGPTHGPSPRSRWSLRRLTYLPAVAFVTLGASLLTTGWIAPVQPSPKLQDQPAAASPTPSPTAISTAFDPLPDLSVQKTAARTEVAVGETLAYTLTVSNEAPVAATGVTIEDDLPPGVTLVSSTPGHGACDGAACDLGVIGPSESVAISVVVLVGAGAAGILSNTACASADSDDFDPSNNCASTDTVVLDSEGDGDTTSAPTALPATSTPSANGLPSGGGLPAQADGGQASLVVGAALLALGALVAGFGYRYGGS
ncbi:MAG TPA: DUF11 domain-containing protein [Dehalococcoidia bacterium]|nr:DUF11 domain-containing protein [Dehalococcoidia bacterium]